MEQKNNPQFRLDGYLNQHVDTVGVASFAEEIKDVFHVINNLEEVPRLAEDIFKHVFLPFFADDPVETRKYPKVDLADWTNVSFNVYREVAIIDADGKELFRVPPIVDYQAVKPGETHADAGGIFSMLVMTRRLQMNSPHMAKNYLDQHLAQKTGQLFNPVNIMSFLRRWNEIFKRYGRAPILALEEDTAAPQSAPTQAPNPSEDQGDWELA